MKALMMEIKVVSRTMCRSLLQFTLYHISHHPPSTQCQIEHQKGKRKGRRVETRKERGGKERKKLKEYPANDHHHS